ncbi:unnamed protein product, partial [Rotaria magnacalcarata]
SQLLPTSSNQSKHLKSRIGRFEDDPAEKNTETGNKQSSLQACVAGLQERVELMDTRFEKINDSLNWIMAAITRVKMAKDNPPYIENPKIEDLPLLIQCATEPRFDPIKVQVSALEILLSLTFKNEAGTLLLQNNTFIQHLRTLVSNSDTPYLQKAADGILWQLFSKHETKHQFEYDVMISYSHKDNDICHRIYKTLTARDFRVWIDLEGMHGAVMQVMANAVKQSRCILICMSESYYLSPYSQSEAQFAFEKQRVLIPIKVQSGYKPDGWLAFLTSGRIYVDFMKTDFNAAFDKVVSEIASSRADEKDSSLILLRSNKSETSTIK